MNRLWPLLSVLLIYSNKPVLSQEFEDLFGQVTLMAGDKYNFKCSVEDTSPGNYYWTLGDRKEKSITKIEDDIVMMEYELVPTLEDNNQELRCWKDDNSDILKISINKQELISQNRYSYKAPTILEAKFIIYPPPNEKDIYWEINGKDGTRQTFHPSENSNMDIEARITSENADNNEYTLQLEINKIDDLKSKNISLTVESSTKKRTIYFQPKLKDMTVNTLSLGVPGWMWILILCLVVVFLFIMGLIIYLIFRRKKGSKTSNGKEYTKAPVQDQQA